MAKGFIFSLCLLLVVNGCLAARQGRTSQQNQCQLNQLQAREPDNRVKAEAGQIETWNYNDDDFQCAGVAASRITIEQNGLHLPSYANAPQLVYIVKGRGLLGLVLSGCPETYEESQEDQSQQQHQQGGRGQREQQEEREEREREQERRSRQEQQQEQGGQRERQEGQEERQREQERRRRQQQQQEGQRGQQLDRHQKVRRVREGDVVAIPAGVAYWSYNDGEQNLVAVSLLDLSNNNNQLDQNPRRFYLAGNPEDEFEQQGRSHRRRRGQSGQRGQSQQEDEEEQRREQQESRREREREQEQQRQSRRSRRGQQQGGNGNNVFSGFSTRLLAQALNVNEETARNLQGQDDNRNQIVRVKGQLDLVQPPRGQQQRQHEQRQEEQLERERQHAQQGGRNDLVMVNGIEETLCSARLTENLQNPERADIYTPQAGRISTLNSHNLPILRLLRLSAERGFFYNNAIYSPHWNLNAHSVVYVLRGDARVQVVNDNGDLILDDQVQEGQLFIVPQNHAVLKQAGNRGFEYIAFKTQDNAMINTLVGRTSVLRALPQEVVANAYQVSRQEARQLKYNRQETAALSSQKQGSSDERRAIA